tara:strand:- start:5516 stop:5788 length:273 start_codon:yes stop_codon:yes gene_type:complete
MGYTPKQAWSNATRLLAICLGFSTDQKRRLKKVSQRYNEGNGYHEITILLEVRQEVLLPTSTAYVIESEGIDSLSLVQEINNRLADVTDS